MTKRKNMPGRKYIRQITATHDRLALLDKLFSEGLAKELSIKTKKEHNGTNTATGIGIIN